MTKIAPTPEMQARWAKEQKTAKTALIITLSFAAVLVIGFILLVAASNALESSKQGLGLSLEEFEQRFRDAPVLSKEDIVDFASREEFEEDGVRYVEYTVGANNRIRATVLDSGEIYSVSATLWMSSDDRIDQSAVVWLALNYVITGDLLIDESSDMAFNISDNLASHSEISVNGVHIEMRPHAGDDGMFDGLMVVHYTKAQ